MIEKYIIENTKYTIEEVTDLEGVYYNVYNKKDNQVEISFIHLDSAKKYTSIK